MTSTSTPAPSSGGSAGSYPSFKRGPGTHFYWQHDAHWQPGGLVSVFDNGSDPAEEKQSRGLLLDPNTATHTVTLVKQFTNPNATLLASSQGDLLSLPGGNWLMGYGGLPNFTEYDSIRPGALRRDTRAQRPGLPHLPRAVERAAEDGAGDRRADGRRRWAERRGKLERCHRGQRLEGPRGASASSLAAVATAAKHGFETTIAVHTSAAYVAVAALDGAGQTIATSAAVSPSH